MPPAELAAHTARRAAASGSRATLLPAEFPARYHQQFVDRLWLRGLVTTGVLYAIGVAIYFCAVGLLAIQTQKVEKGVADISGSYTNALQLKAQYDVLKERQELKYAALDCWKIVAEQLPPNITLQRFSFADGKKLSLSGTAAADQVNTLFDFNTAMQKVTANGRPMFNAQGGEPVNPHPTGNGCDLEFQFATAKRGGDAMKKYFAHLRPLERRLAVGVVVVLILVLNFVFIWPHFSDWSQLKTRLKNARDHIGELPGDHRPGDQLPGAGEKPGRPG